MGEILLIVGLGNPGAKYENTRHNVGFMAVEELARKHNIAFDKNEHKSLVASGRIANQRVIIAKPQTYMNKSGDAVRMLVNFYKVEHEDILLICDDIDLAAGSIRLRKTGSSGGQNGLKHIFQQLGTQDIHRGRIGLGRPPGRMDPAAFVLQKLKDDDAIFIAETVSRMVAAIETWTTDGIELAMTRHNGRAPEAEAEKKSKATETKD